MTYDRDEVTTASNAEADLLCQGRFKAQIGLPDKASPDAVFGREIHEALKTGDSSKLSYDQNDIYDSIQAIELKMLVEFFGANAPKAQKHVEREVAFVIEDHVTEYLHGCTPDVVYRYGTHVLIIEYKSLSGDIKPADSNLQMRDQVVVVSDGYFLVNEIGSVVIQPLSTHSPRICIYTNGDINQARKEMWERVARSHAPNPMRTAGEKQCAFCRAKLLCCEYQIYATRQLPVPVSLMDCPVALWSQEQRRIFCDHKGTAAKWLKETTDAMKEGVKRDPDFVPGWGLDEGDERRVVTDMQRLFDRFQAIGGTLPMFMDCVKLTIGDFTEAVAGVSNMKGKRLKERVDQMFDGIVTINKTEPALVKKKESK